ncbi:MAG: hypothetical protein C4527_03020 [Candidatus Omnitrophota bacterium]|nr:MAG: hypothetical protein C4527_03020 [Candidatus Omnitrophota bacterium]
MLEFWLELAKGPIFRFSFALCVLGLARIVMLSAWGAAKAYYAAGDKELPYSLIWRTTIHWLFPIRMGLRNRPFFSIVSILFHIGLIIVPIFLFAHIQLWYQGAGLWWPAIPRHLAEFLTVTTILSAILLFLARVWSSASRHISRGQEFMWPLLLIIPFLSGFFCSHPAWSPLSYNAMLLIHILSGNFILLLIPLTKISHCILTPFSQFISELGWHFPKNSAKDVEITLGKQGQPI